MIWVMYGGIIAGVVLMLAALIVVIPQIVRTQRHAKAIVPSVLIAKFQKAQDDLARVQGASVLLEELTVRAREAIERIREAAEVLGSLRVVPIPNRD
jgi:predicted alpha-1,6-mannanase (GH76 family)